MHPRILLPTLLTASIASLPATAQCPSGKLVDANGANGDGFAATLGADADRLLVGSPSDDDIGLSSGSATRFELTATGYRAVETWHAFDGQLADNFGATVDIAGGHAAVAALAADANGVDSGAVYLFEDLGGANWAVGPKLLGSTTDAGDGFGAALDLDLGSIDRLVVGSPFDEGGLAAPTGCVHVFERASGTGAWSEVQVLQPAELLADDRFGTAVALQGDRLLIGAPGADLPASETGAVYVFEHDGSQFVQVDRLLPSAAGLGQRIGSSVGLDGDLMVVGAIGPVQGRAYVYEYDGAVWNESDTLWGASASGVNFFGVSVAIEGERVLVGASRQSGAGAAFLFERRAGSWIELARVDGENTNDEFGFAVDLDSRRLLVGARRANNDLGATTAGAAHVFETEGVDCNGNGVPDACDLFSGTSLDANANGIPDECECSATRYCSSSPNSTGGAARLELVGSTSVSTNDFTLRARPVPNQPGLFYYGAGQIDVPFGNGRRCVGGAVHRLPIRMATAQVLEFTYDLTMPPGASGQILAGSQWNFQAWFRDPAGGGSAFDLSDALSVGFCD